MTSLKTNLQKIDFFKELAIVYIYFSLATWAVIYFIHQITLLQSNQPDPILQGYYILIGLAFGVAAFSPIRKLVQNLKNEQLSNMALLIASVSLFTSFLNYPDLNWIVRSLKKDVK